ncbi:zinc finger protein 318-like isoform X1 [Pleurodeles waltl]|uniref:zinc finger protein 318-like isoform X1 n=1 Tax=Pleurodeles waltl TaxID=8319 RepID=UPI003709A4AE
MERPRDKRSPRGHSGSRSHRGRRSVNGSRPRSLSPGSRPRSPPAPHRSRLRSPHGSRPRSPRSHYGSRPRSPHRSRPRSPYAPRYSHGPRSRSPHGSHGRRPGSRSPRYRAFRSRSPVGDRDYRSYSPLGLRPRGSRERSPYLDRPRSPYLPLSPGSPLPLRSPYSPGRPSRRSSPGPRSPHGCASPSSRALPDPGSSWRLHACPARPRDPGDLRYRLTRPSGDSQRWSPLSDHAEVEESLRITVGNDFYNRSSRERTRLSCSLDDVSDTSRDELIGECNLTQDHSLGCLRSTLEEEEYLSPLTVRNDTDYRRRHASHPLNPLSLRNNRRSLDNYHTRYPEDLEVMPIKSILKNQNEQEPCLPFQHEGFMSSSGFGRERSPLTNPNVLQHRVRPFSSLKENVTERMYKTLEQCTQSSIPMRTEECFPNAGERCNILGKRVDSDSFSGILPPSRTAVRDDCRVSNNLNITVNDPSMQQKMFLTNEEEEAFLYGNPHNSEDELQHSTKILGTSVRERVPAVMEDKLTVPNLTSSQEATIAHEKHPELQKIQDLLKNIGVEIGDIDIGKLSVRTRERLYGKNLPSNSRERRPSETQLQEPYQISNRSETRSPESNHKHSLSPTWSMQSSKDRLSYTKSEVSGKGEDRWQQLPIPTLGQQQAIPTLGQQQAIPTLGQQQAIPTLGQQQAISSLGQQQAISSLGQQQAISSLGQQQAISSLGQQQAISSLGQQQAISSLGQQQAISSLGQQQAISSLGHPLNIPPHQSPMMVPASHFYQVLTFAQHTTAHMLPTLMNAAPPSSPFLTPTYVPNTSIPPPVFFPPPPIPNYMERPNTQIPPPSIQAPFASGGYGHGMPPTGPIPSGPPDPFLRTVSKHRNLKVIQTTTERKKIVVKPAETQKQDSCHLVYIETENTSSKSTPPLDDKNRVAQKVKVLRDLEKLKSDRVVREKKLSFLQKKLESLTKKHSEILQNKGQQNKFHTNPLLTQAKRIEDELVALCKAAADADEQQASLKKVAKILGLNISEKSNPPAQTQKTAEKQGMGSNTVKSSVPVEPKAQTQVGTATSS